MNIKLPLRLPLLSVQNGSQIALLPLLVARLAQRGLLTSCIPTRERANRASEIVLKSRQFWRLQIAFKYCVLKPQIGLN